MQWIITVYNFNYYYNVSEWNNLCYDLMLISEWIEFMYREWNVSYNEINCYSLPKTTSVFLIVYE